MLWTRPRLLCFPELNLRLNVTPPPSPPPEDPLDPIWRFKIKAGGSASETLYFWGPACRWEDVKRWIHQQTGVPTTLFHLVLAINGVKVNNTDFIDARWIKDWQSWSC